MVNTHEEMFDNIVVAVDTKDRLLQQSSIYQDLKQTIGTNPKAYFSIPIILHLTLIISNLLAFSGALFHAHYFLLPWLIIYFVAILSSSSLLVYLIVIIKHIWFKVILFLTVGPVIVIAISFWTVIAQYYKRLSTKNKKSVQLYTHARCPPITQLKEEYPIPISTLAVSPPLSAWDPEYLIERDPRYLHPQTGQSLEDSYRLEEGSEITQTAECVSDSESHWSSEESYYRSDEYTERDAREDTEDFTESDADILGTYQHSAIARDNEYFTESDTDTYKHSDRYNIQDARDTENSCESGGVLLKTIKNVEAVDTIAESDVVSPDLNKQIQKVLLYLIKI